MALVISLNPFKIEYIAEILPPFGAWGGTSTEIKLVYYYVKTRISPSLQLFLNLSKYLHEFFRGK
jgi:hypothetical protein